MSDIRYTAGVQFRAPTEAPTTEGWYYGRSISHGQIDPQPRYVHPRFGDELSVDLHTSSTSGRLDEFEWFGTVDEVKVASRGT